MKQVLTRVGMMVLLLFFLSLVSPLQVVPGSAGETEMDAGFSVERGGGYDYLRIEEEDDYLCVTIYNGARIRFLPAEEEGEHYSWNFGDGETGESQEWKIMAHNFSQPRPEGYNVRLTVKKEDTTRTYNATVVVLSLPSVRLNLEDGNGLRLESSEKYFKGKVREVYTITTGDPLICNASGSVGHGSLNYSWDFKLGPEGFNPANPSSYGMKTQGPVASFRYSDTGSYEMMLLLRDENKQGNYSQTVFIRVNPAPEEDVDSLLISGELAFSLALILLLLLGFLARTLNAGIGEKKREEDQARENLFPTEVQEEKRKGTWSFRRKKETALNTEDELSYSVGLEELRKGEK